MEEILLLALIGEFEDDIPMLMLQSLAERRGKRRIRSVEFPRFNLDNFTPEDCLLNFRFDRDGHILSKKVPYLQFVAVTAPFLHTALLCPI